MKIQNERRGQKPGKKKPERTVKKILLKIISKENQLKERMYE